MNVLLVRRSVAIIQSSAVAAHGDARQLFRGVRCGSEAKAAQLDTQAYSKWLQVRKEIELSTWLPKQHSIGYNDLDDERFCQNVQRGVRSSSRSAKSAGAPTEALTQPELSLDCVIRIREIAAWLRPTVATRTQRVRLLESMCESMCARWQARPQF